MRMLVVGLIVSAAVTGCATTDYDPHVAAVENQLEARAMQTRELGADSYQALVTAVIGTLQDHHFRIVEIDPDLGTITAYQVTNHLAGTPLSGRTTLTVLVRERGAGIYRVRMNMSIGPRAETTAELYQQFFAALQRKLHYQASA